MDNGRYLKTSGKWRIYKSDCGCISVENRITGQINFYPCEKHRLGYILPSYNIQSVGGNGKEVSDEAIKKW